MRAVNKKLTHSAKSGRAGFTLIELILVIVIIGIIASVTLPKFVNFKTRATERSEDYIAGALITAIQTAHLSYVVIGFEDSWPCSVSGDASFCFTGASATTPGWRHRRSGPS